MEPAAKRTRIADGRAMPAASFSSPVPVPSSVAAPPAVALAASAAAADSPPVQPLSAEMVAVNELMRQHPQQAKKMLAASQAIVAEGPLRQQTRSRAGQEPAMRSISGLFSVLVADNVLCVVWPVQRRHRLIVFAMLRW
jgi:hypothetical protein